MTKDWFNLSWLLPPPDDFTARVEELQRGVGAQNFKSAANFQLNDNQLRKLAKVVKNNVAPKGLDIYNLVVISNANAEFFHGAFVGTALRHGLWLSSSEEAMGQTVAAILNPESKARNEHTDGVLLALTHHALALPERFGDLKGAGESADTLLQEIALIEQTLQQSNKATLIVQTIAMPPEFLFGSYDARVYGTMRQVVSEFNAMLRASKHHVIDIAALAEMVGLTKWYDIDKWHWAKIPFAQNLLPLYADHVCRYLGAIRGKSKKCLVLDLDNTLWGGVIGDDGLEGIALGQNSPKGEAYLAIQHLAKDLKRRGVVLAVCSKNEESNARLPFQKHPEMVLKEDDFAVFVANWNDKAGNIQAIAEALDLTPDSFVFLDDNPAEREIIRRDMPMVSVPEVPNHDVSLYPLILSAAGYFEAAQFTDNDMQRADQYAANAKRNTLKTQARDLTEYLKSLEMDLEVGSFIPADQSRVSQLINRSNQFNLTTRRYTEDDVAAIEKDPSIHGFAFRLRDKFGDNGIICIIICKEQGEDWYIDTWLMSCRVLGREIEKATLSAVAEAARMKGKKRLIGHYIPTAKNGMVEKHFEMLGFEHEKNDGEETYWTLNLAAFNAPDIPLTIVSMDKKA